MKSVFVSYNWAQEDFADTIEGEISPYAEVVRDKNTLKAWCSLSDFMKRIRSEDFAVLLISDEYLKSINCMYEVSQLIKDDNWVSKVFFVVFENAQKIYDVSSRRDYLTYWYYKRKKLEESNIALPFESRSGEIKELHKINDILNCIGEFLEKVGDLLNPKLDEAIKEILERIKSDGVSLNQPQLNTHIERTPEDIRDISDKQAKGFNFVEFFYRRALGKTYVAGRWLEITYTPRNMPISFCCVDIIYARDGINLIATNYDLNLNINYTFTAGNAIIEDYTLRYMYMRILDGQPTPDWGKFTFRSNRTSSPTVYEGNFKHDGELFRFKGVLVKDKKDIRLLDQDFKKHFKAVLAKYNNDVNITYVFR